MTEQNNNSQDNNTIDATETIDYCIRLILDQINKDNYHNSGLTKEEYIKKMSGHLQNLQNIRM
jgi:hypothetical protein